MHRAGQQPPQRPPALTPNPALGGPYRGQPFQNFGLPQRNVAQGYPMLPSQRTVLPQPSPNFLQQQQQRTQSNFPYSAGTLQQQQQQAQSPAAQLSSQTTLSHAAHQQQTQGSGASSTLPPHLTQNAAPSLGTAPSVSSQSEVGLDPNDFPALGATPANNSSAASSGNTTSYASQAGTGAGGSGGQAGNGAGANQPRDFTAEDFPALGGQSQTTQQQAQQAQQTPTDGHPPGLNGFQHADQQHRQSLLGSLTGNGQGQQQQQPGLLNLGQARNVHPGFQSEADKQRNFTVKNNHANAAAAAWNSPNVNPSATPAATFPNGQQNHVQNAQAQTTAPQQPQQQQGQQHLNAPPGVPPPAYSSQPTPAQQTPYVANGAVAVPQTPAQQVLMSPADRWGLLGLLALIKSADPDQSLLTIGTDLGTMGLDMQNPGSLYSTFITPWADSSAAHTVEPDFHLPACYNVQPPPPSPNKVAVFSDETLFFMFYASPRDALQEIAAQELYNRNWRYHKELRLWITKESGTQPSQKVPGGEQGTYSYWDPDMWEKSRKEMTVLYADLEEKNQPLFAAGQTLQMNAPPQPHTPAQPGRVGAAFQGIAMGAM